MDTLQHITIFSFLFKKKRTEHSFVSLVRFEKRFLGEAASVPSPLWSSGGSVAYLASVCTTLKHLFLKEINGNSYGSLLFLNFSSISSKSAHDIRVANIEYCSLNKICIHEV
jgi:hypothetical protein